MTTLNEDILKNEDISNLVCDDIDENEDIAPYPIENFKLTTTPNDFNISTIISFLDSGIFKIPDFQRNYVWDDKKASKLIESLLIGLPIPQMFLYEQARNEFYVIDGQQRMMSIYFFVKGRFPKQEARALLKEKSGDLFIEEKFLNDEKYFTNFNLKLNSPNNPHNNKFHGKNYKTLEGSDKITLDLATIRNMVIKPSLAGNDDSQAMFEIFNRLNSGGMNLNNQEIRMSLFHSKFLTLLQDLNKNSTWRKLLKKEDKDLRLRDIENILRLYGMLLSNVSPIFKDVEYQNSMNGFLNKVANAAKKLKDEDLEKITQIWEKFMTECSQFQAINFNFSENSGGNKNNQISITFFEALFYATCKEAFELNDMSSIKITTNLLDTLKNSEDFKNYSTGKTSSRNNVEGRLTTADKIFKELTSNNEE